jgi:hypothetical protein
MKRELLIVAVTAIVLAVSQPAAQAHTPTEIITSFYPKYLHRKADRSGVHYWYEQHRHGLPLREIEARLVAGDEYYRVHGGTAVGFVQGMLLELNGVAPPDRVAYYLGRLQTTGSRLVVAREALGLIPPPPVVVVQPQPVIAPPQPPPVVVQPVVSQAPPVVEAPLPQPQPGAVYVPAATPPGGPVVVTAPPTTVVVPEPAYVPVYQPGTVYYPQYSPYRSSFNLNLVLPIGRR